MKLVYFKGALNKADQLSRRLDFKLEATIPLSWDMARFRQVQIYDGSPSRPCGGIVNPCTHGMA
jgi:hypothetical protein